jgi:hypothetical protein
MTHILEFIMKTTALAFATLTLVALTACDKQESKPAAPKPAAAGSPAPGATLPASLFLAAQPADAKPLEDAKKSAKAGDAVTLRGRIGGSEDPFVSGRAVFTLVGPGLKACSDNADDGCKTPWDYCCDTKEEIAAHSATIQVVDAAGAPLKLSVKGQNGLKELSDVIIVGKVAQAEGSVLVVNASGLYIAAK